MIKAGIDQREQRMNALTTLSPTNMAEAMSFSDVLAKSSMVPKEYQNRPANVLVAVAWGMELGLAPMQAMQNIAVINGKPSIYGDAALAVAMAHPSFVDCEERITGDGDNMHASCTIKRKGRAPVISTFSVHDAKRAGLWGKAGPWSQYPKRMLQMRARGFALRDAFPDALRGLITQEEARDIHSGHEILPPEGDLGPLTRVDATPVDEPLHRVTINDLRDAARRAISRTSREDVLETLSSLGYSKADEVPDEERATVLAALEDLSPLEAA